MAYYSKLKTGESSFAEMMTGFGVVTVMNAKVYEIDSTFDFSKHDAEKIREHYLSVGKKLAEIDTLKIANVTVEGPNKTVTGGQYSNPLIKFGKSARLEMQDALGRADAIEAFGGSINEYNESSFKTVVGMHITEDFAPTRLIIGDSFFISRKTGQQVKVNIIFYQVLPDSIFNLNQDAEGDATVFDMNADLLTTVIKVADENGNKVEHGVFYSVIPASTTTPVYSINENYVIILDSGYTATLDGATVTSGTTAVEAGQAGLLVISKGNEVVLTTTIVHPAEQQ